MIYKLEEPDFAEVGSASPDLVIHESAFTHWQGFGKGVQQDAVGGIKVVIVGEHLLQIMEDRHGKASTIITSQLPIKE